MRSTSKLLIVILASLACSLTLINHSSAAISIEKIKTSKVASFGCGGQNAQGFTITPNYYIAGCGHSGPTKTYKKSKTKSVVASKKISGDNGDLDYYAPKDYLVVGGKYFYNPSTLKQTAVAKYSLGFNANYDAGDDVFIVASRNKVEVRGNILNEKSPKRYKSFSTVRANQGSFYHNGVFYRVVYCLRSGINGSTCKGANISKGQSAVIAYDVTTGKKVGHYITPNYDQAGELQDGSVYNGIGYVSSGGGGVYKITGPASLLKLINQKNPMRFNKGSGQPSQQTGGDTDGGGQSSTTQPGSSGGSDQTQNEVKFEPTHDSKCATILSFWCDNADTDGEGTILNIIKFIIGTLSIGVTVLGTVGLIYCGYLFMTARDNMAQTEKAKKRIVEIVIGLVVWALFALLITLLLPASADVVESTVGIEWTRTLEIER
ncbi:TrbC/VirB2 family protein [Candidatus Saccharibacteria bacterium]|nr:TrbC/VirB2 family protein [Candidatus Saccharibacteria bacterium]